MAKLTVRQVQALRAPGFFGDGDGLYLQVSASGGKAWVLRFQMAGRRRDMGLGSAAVVTLADARQRAAEARRLISKGIDPIERRAAAAVAPAPKVVTFQHCAERYIAAHKAGWRNAKHAAQWSATLETYAYPHFGALPVAAVDVGLVLEALEPIWATKPETAGRVRGRIEAVLDWARARGYREGENPARWRGLLDALLPPQRKIRAVKHHAALPFTQIGAFVAELRQQDGVAARALEFAVLTAGRTAEVIGARWDEIALAERLWTIPAERMKAGREHRVPLSSAALAILEEMAATRLNGYVFPGWRAGSERPISNMAMLMTLRRMGRADLTVHGFRSCHRDWISERTDFPAEVAEMALAHTVGDKVEAAYRRGDLFEKRRALAEAWAKYCSTPPSTGRVVPIRA